MANPIKVLTPDNVESIYDLEMERLASIESDEMQRNLISWESPWRKESLNHYANTGWSFIMHSENDSNKVLGYILGQAFVFFRNQTQTLWIEHLGATSTEVTEELVEVAYRWARDKHLQRVIFHQANEYSEYIKSFKGYLVSAGDWEIKTTKG